MISNWIYGEEQKHKFIKYSGEFDHGYGNGHEKLLKLSQKLLYNKNVDNFVGAVNDL